MSATIRHEPTRNGNAVAYVYSFCSSCTYWHAFSWTIDDAHAASDRHLANVHGVPLDVLANRRRNREAARAKVVTDTPPDS